MQKEKIDIKKILEDGGPTRKFDGIAPEDFVLVHTKTLEDLKNFETWKKWKHNEITIKTLNNLNYEPY
jgi:hypothetical protein